MKALFAFFIAATLLLSPTSRAVVIASNLQGWVGSFDQSDGAAAGNNTYTGLYFGEHLNSWANFNLSGLTGTVTGAQLVMNTNLWQGHTQANYSIGVYDVSSSLAQLAEFSDNMDKFIDLETGNQYANAQLGDNSNSLINLSSVAVANINSLLGGNFQVGFTNLSIANIFYDDGEEGLFTNQPFAPQLILYGANNISSAAEPSSLGCFLLAIFAVARLRKARV